MKAESEWIDALLDPKRPIPAGLRAWNGSDPTQRFAVYRNNVIVSLVDALAETFAVTQQLVGEEFFRAMAREFVRRSPPRSPLLADYGGEFPAFVASFPPAEKLPYLADTVRLELVCIRALHAADADPVGAAALQGLLEDERALAASRFTLHPCLQTLESDWAIASLWAAHQGLQDIADVDPSEAENVWVMRSDLRVAVLRMRTGDCRFAGLLRRGETLAEATNLALESDPGFDLSACLAVLLREQLITAVEQ